MLISSTLCSFFHTLFGPYPLLLHCSRVILYLLGAIATALLPSSSIEYYRIVVSWTGPTLLFLNAVQIVVLSCAFSRRVLNPMLEKRERTAKALILLLATVGLTTSGIIFHRLYKAGPSSELARLYFAFLVLLILACAVSLFALVSVITEPAFLGLLLAFIAWRASHDAPVSTAPDTWGSLHALWAKLSPAGTAGATLAQATKGVFRRPRTALCRMPWVSSALRCDDTKASIFAPLTSAAWETLTALGANFAMILLARWAVRALTPQPPANARESGRKDTAVAPTNPFLAAGLRALSLLVLSAMALQHNAPHNVAFRLAQGVVAWIAFVATCFLDPDNGEGDDAWHDD